MRRGSRRALLTELAVAEAGLFRVRRICQQSLDRGQATVDARTILEAADPLGEWEYTAVPRQQEGPAAEQPDPRADPLTGCLPVTADQQP